MTRVVNETHSYYDAITHSVTAAEEGFNFANDAMEYCDRLAEATESIESLIQGLEEMVQIAEQAYISSLAMSLKFREVRTNLSAVCFSCHP